jgi:DNA repair exonuclease SbcCD ATPase subunit
MSENDGGKGSGKDTVKLRPETEKETVKVDTGVVRALEPFVEEMRGIRKDGQERGKLTQILADTVKSLDTAVKTYGVQLQQYYELFGGKIRTLEGRADSADQRAAGHEAQLAELKRQLETRLTELEKEIESTRSQLATLGDTKLGVSVLPGMEAKISLNEEQMADKLAEEAAAHAAKLAEEKAAREAADAAVDKRVESRMAPLEIQMSTLLTALNVRPPPPPGSIPPKDDEKKKKPKNAIEKQSTLVKTAIVILSMVGTGGVLDKIGLLDAFHRYFATWWAH